MNHCLVVMVDALCFAILCHPTLSKMSLTYNKPCNLDTICVLGTFKFFICGLVLFLTLWRPLVLALSGNAQIV